MYDLQESLSSCITQSLVSQIDKGAMQSSKPSAIPQEASGGGYDADYGAWDDSPDNYEQGYHDGSHDGHSVPYMDSEEAVGVGTRPLSPSRC
eukprot:scaffold129273_cov24-Prasinocladus_malaysianus.AAC.1